MLPIPQLVQHSPSLISPIPIPHTLPHTLRSPYILSSSTTTTEIPKPSTASMLYKTEDKVLVSAPAVIPIPLLAATRDNAYAKLQPQPSSSSSSSSSSFSSSSSLSSSSESSSNTSSLVDRNEIDLQLHKEEATREFPVLLLPPSLSLSLAHTKETPLLPPFIPQIPVLTNSTCHDGMGSGRALDADKSAEQCKSNVSSTVASSPSEIKELQSSQTGAASCQPQLWKSVQTSSSLPPPPPEILPKPPLSSSESSSSLLPTNSNVHTCATELAIPIPPVIPNDNCNSGGSFTQSLYNITTPPVNVNLCTNVDTTNREKIDNINAIKEINAKPTTITAAMNIVPVLETSMQSSNLVIFGGARYNVDKRICTLPRNTIRHDAQSQSKNLFCKACKRCDRHILQRKCTRLTHELSNLSTLLQLSTSTKEDISNKPSIKPAAASSHVACSILAEGARENCAKEEEQQQQQQQQQELISERDNSDDANIVNKCKSSDSSVHGNAKQNNSNIEVTNAIWLHPNTESDANVKHEQQHTITEEERKEELSPQPQEEQQEREKNLPKIASECSVEYSIINVNELHLETDKKNNLCTIAFFGTPCELQKALANIEEQFEEGNQCCYWLERLECEQQGYVKFERREWGIKRNVGAKMTGDSGEHNKNSCNYTIGFGKRTTPLQFAAIAKKLANVILLLLHGARDDDEPTLQQILSVDEYAIIDKLIDRVNTNAAAMIKSTCKYSEKVIREIEGKEAH